MGRITMDEGAEGLAGFPAGYRPIARDDLGDVLAVDAAGKVWCFPHGAGDWRTKHAAFRSVAQLREHVAFQDAFDGPADGEDLNALRARKRKIDEFVAKQVGARYSRDIAKQAAQELRDAIAELHFKGSAPGRSLAERQELGLRCEQILREAGATGRWAVRAHSDDARAIVVLGRFDAPWTEDRVRQLLRPVAGRYELAFRSAPATW